MTTTAEDLKRQILANRISNTRSLNNEAALKWELNRFFQRVRDKVLKELEEYYPKDTGVLLEGHVDLILAPIFESQQEYYNILRKFNDKEYNFGANEAKRLVKLARKPIKGASKSQKIKLESLFDTRIEKDTLFGTQDFTRDKLQQQSFTASESTINRVDSDINQILTDGYTSGKGIHQVRDDITRRFGQLQDWEANRIARTEIHNAHQMGMMNTYNELGVEYIQWSSARDSRVRGLKKRDKANHVILEGEIIPLGGTFSNGLRFPGDTTGRIEEWINCRCSAIPFIIPDGYMAPSFSPFKETDLIPTLDYWNQDDLIAQATQETQSSSRLKGFKIDDELPLDTTLMEREFRVAPDELAEDFEISSKGMETIRQFQKEAYLSENEMGFAFSENNGRIRTGLIQGNEDWIGIRTPGKSSTIHNHTSKGFTIPSGDDFFAYLKTVNERLAFNCSNDEIWVIHHANKKGLSNEYVNSIADKVDELAYKYSQKFKQEYHRELKRINKITDPKLKQSELDRLKKDVNTKLLKKYNQELGDELLEYVSTVEGLKVKRYINVPIDKKKISDLPKLKLEKNKGEMRRANLINKDNLEGKYSRKTIEINKDPKKVVNLNGKKVYGVEESEHARIAFEIKFGILKEELTKEEYKFIKLYSGKGFSILNSYLREIANINNPKLIRKIKRKYALKWAKLIIYHPRQYMSFDKSLKVLSDVFKKGKVLEEDLVVVRRQKESMIKYANNGIYHSDACLSTSISENVKPEEYGDYVNYIVIPKGTRILYIEGITSTRWEYEILLNKNIDLELIREESEHLVHWKLL